MRPEPAWQDQAGRAGQATTIEELARSLLNHRQLHVITNKLNVAVILADHPGCEVILAAGVVRGRDRVIVGGAAIDFIRRFKVDVGIIGISSIESDGVLRDFDQREVGLAQAIIEQSREVWLLATQEKFGRKALARVAHLSRITTLFTDAEPTAMMREALRSSAVKVVVVA
ncbi:DeoR/GlpR family transcriptional regulator of sugar metabolism [Janthinobacterium sp. CG_23.3]